MILTLSIKEQFLKELISGKKKEDYREATEYSIKKFCNLDDKGEIIDVKTFDKVRFYTGKYLKGQPRPFAEFAIKEIFIEEVTDEAGDGDFEFTIIVSNLLADNFSKSISSPKI